MYVVNLILMKLVLYVYYIKYYIRKDFGLIENKIEIIFVVLWVVVLNLIYYFVCKKCLRKMMLLYVCVNVFGF